MSHRDGELLETKTYRLVKPLPKSWPLRFEWGDVTMDKYRMHDGSIKLTDGLGSYYDPSYFDEVV